MTKGPKGLSEKWFEAYLSERGLRGGDDHHPDLGGQKKPDYRVSRGDPAAIVEVKEFRTSTMHDHLEASSGFTTLSDRVVYGTTRNKINEALSQLKPYAGRGEPLIVALANPHQLWTPIEQPKEMIAAMYGNPAFVVPISVSSGAAVSDGEAIFDRDGVFGGGLHRYVSAVLTLHRREHAADAKERWTEENRHIWAGIEDRVERMAAAFTAHQDPGFEEAAQTPGAYFFTRVFSTPGTLTGDAVPVPVEMFNGPCDEYWTINAGTGCLELAPDK